MGAQQQKQPKGQTQVTINHPKFDHAKIIDQSGTLYLQTSMAIDQKEYDKWKKQINKVKKAPQYLFIPENHQFITKGFCGSTGTLTTNFNYYPYLLQEEIESRKQRKSKFEQSELWFLLFSLSAAQSQMKKYFESKVGDIRPQNVFINHDGHIKLSNLCSWPKQQSNFQKSFDHQLTFLAPQDMNKLQLGGMQDLSDSASQMFSIGFTVLSAALLSSFQDVYDVKRFKFKYQQASQYLHEWRTNTIYSQIFTAFISNLCSFEPQKRLLDKQLWSWISKFDQQIKDKVDFVIQHAPIKIQKEIKQLRGQSNINLLHEGNQHPIGFTQVVTPVKGFNTQFIPPQNIGFNPNHQNFSQQAHQIPPHLFNSIQQKSNVFPYNHGIIGQSKYVPARNSSYPVQPTSPRQRMVHYQNTGTIPQIHPNIQTAESMYTQISPELYQRQFQTLPRGVQLNSDQHMFVPPQVVRQPPLMNSQIPMMNPQISPGINGEGNYVYTRRVIDPTSNKVVHEQRIGQQQYVRGSRTNQGAQNDY